MGRQPWSDGELQAPEPQPPKPEPPPHPGESQPDVPPIHPPRPEEPIPPLPVQIGSSSRTGCARRRQRAQETHTVQNRGKKNLKNVSAISACRRSPEHR